MKKLYFLFAAIILSLSSYGQVAAISGPSVLCSMSSATYSDTTTGGSWSVSSTALLTIGSTSGIATPVATGTCIISYTVGSYSATYPVTIYASPAAISGASSVCSGSYITLTDATPGGTWSSSAAGVATVSTTGIVTGVSAGVTTISYTISTGCYTTHIVTVGVAGTSAITGVAYVCIGATTSLSDATSGGSWSSSDTSIATISTGGVVTGVSAGTVTISYTATSTCSSGIVTRTETVYAPPAAISGPTSVCVGGTITETDVTTGGFWSSSTPGVFTVDYMTGIITGVASGTASIMYTLSSGGCYSSASITVSTSATIIASATTGVCNGGIDTLTASGASGYSWSPSTGLSCSTCATTTVTTTGTTIYTVTSAGAGCSGAGTVTVDGNRIKGEISFSGTAPSSLDMKVWLIQYNSTDSSLIAEDSMLTCLEGGTTPYYQFNDKPSGDYLVKAQLLSSVAGTSGYIPTYGASSPHWDSATTTTHSGAADVQNINMIYGTVPSGPGFISGLIVDGAGKHTSGDVPDPDVLVYLEDASSHVLTYTYTNAYGIYAFSGLAYGTYIIYPTVYKYRTTPSSVITLTATADSSNAVNFKQHNTFGTITPYSIPAGVNQLPGANSILVSPNPSTGNISIAWYDQSLGSADVVVTDMLGREVYKSLLSINSQSGNRQLSLSALNSGMYFISIRSGSINYSGKLQIAK